MIVVLRALGLGDFLTAVPAYRAVRRAFGRERVVVAAPAALRPLAELVGGIELVDARPLEPLDRALHDAQVAVNLHGRGPQSHRVLLAARPLRLVAYRHDEIAESSAGPVHEANEHEVRRWCRLLAWYGIAADPDDLDLPRPALAVPRRLRDATLLHVGAGAVARRWPPERWAAVVRDLVAQGERVLVSAGAAEAGDAHRVAELGGLPPTHVLAGRTSLLELAALVAAARRVVCTDTGVAHLATAFRRPSLILFGPSSPRIWGPPPQRPWHRVLWHGVTGDANARTVDPGLLRITPEQVRRALNRLQRPAG